MTKKERTSTAAISRSLTAVRAGCARTVGGGTAARAAKESGCWACCPAAAVVGTPGEDAAAGAAAWGATACDAPTAWSAQSAVGHTHCCAVCSQGATDVVSPLWSDRREPSAAIRFGKDIRGMRGRVAADAVDKPRA